MKTAKKLFEEANKLDYKNSGMEPVPELLQLGFFPGGNGIIKDDEAIDPSNSIEGKEIMIVGNNFGTVCYYCKCFPKKQEDILKNPTWRNLLKLLKDSGIKKESCFFTNAYMGLIDEYYLIKREIKSGIKYDNKGNVGACPGSKKHEFVKQCQDFFCIQLDFLPKLKLVIVLGKQAPILLMEIFPDLNWKGTFKEIDIDGNQIITTAFPSTNNKIVFTIITHPSDTRNQKLRKYKNRVGEKFEEKKVEVEILKEAMRIAGL